MNCLYILSICSFCEMIAETIPQSTSLRLVDSSLYTREPFLLAYAILPLLGEPFYVCAVLEAPFNVAACFAPAPYGATQWIPADPYKVLFSFLFSIHPQRHNEQCIFYRQSLLCFSLAGFYTHTHERTIHPQTYYFCFTCCFQCIQKIPAVECNH